MLRGTWWAWQVPPRLQVACEWNLWRQWGSPSLLYGAPAICQFPNYLSPKGNQQGDLLFFWKTRNSSSCETRRQQFFIFYFPARTCLTVSLLLGKLKKNVFGSIKAPYSQLLSIRVGVILLLRPNTCFLAIHVSDLLWWLLSGSLPRALHRSRPHFHLLCFHSIGQYKCNYLCYT